MAIKFKRRNAGGALVAGTAPLITGAGGIQSGEPVYDAIADVLYIGKGDDGAGNSTAISAVGGGGAFVKAAQIGAALGVASLDAAGKLPSAQLPASITGAMVYQGTWNAGTNLPALTSGSGSKGAFYKVSASGNASIDGNASWNVGDIIAFDGTAWDKIDGPAEAVTSVAGRVGAVTLTHTDISDWTTTLAAALTAFAPLTSPAFIGTPTAPTPTAGTNTTQLATTAFIQAALTAYAPTAIDGGAI